MNELVTIKKTVIGNDEVNAVDARELHEFIGSKQQFGDWIKSKVVENVFFEENIDYVLLRNISEQTCNSRGGHNKKDYALTIDTAKKVAMAEQTARGNEVREYFIKCEKALNQIIDTSNLKSETKEIIEAQLLTTKYLKEMLNYSEVSTLKIIYKINESHGIPTNYLPNYVENQKVVFSLTDLLSKHDIKMSTMSFNKLLEANGIIETKTRKSRSTKSGTKTFKALTPFGLQFGRNDSSPHNKNEVQPLYFEDTFDKLLSIISFKAAA